MPKKSRTRTFDASLNLSVAQASFRNARDLLQTAVEAGSNERFGVGSSLTVVALEELGKALVLRFSSDIDDQASRTDPSPPGAARAVRTTTSVFDEHTTKKLMLLAIVPWLKARNYSAERGVQVPPIDAVKIGEWLQSLRPAIEGGQPPNHEVSVPGQPALVDFLRSWIASLAFVNRAFERFRLSGFYVDVADGRLRTPNEVTRAGFERLRDYATETTTLVAPVIADGFPADFVAAMWKLAQPYIRVTATYRDIAGRVLGTHELKPD